MGSVFSTAIGFVIWVSKSFPYLVIIEATYQGAHTLRVIYTLKMGFYFFVISEAMFFTSFFLSIFSCYVKSFTRNWRIMTPKRSRSYKPFRYTSFKYHYFSLIWYICFSITSFCKGKNKELAMMTLN